MESLSEQLELQISRQVNVESVCDYIMFAEHFHLDALKQRACMYALVHLSAVKDKCWSKWNELSVDTRCMIEKWDQLLFHAGPIMTPNEREQEKQRIASTLGS